MINAKLFDLLQYCCTVNVEIYVMTRRTPNSRLVQVPACPFCRAVILRVGDVFMFIYMFYFKWCPWSCVGSSVPQLSQNVKTVRQFLFLLLHFYSRFSAERVPPFKRTVC